MYMTCALAIYTGGLHAHAHVMATAASSAHARVHRKRCSHMHAHNQSSLTQKHIYLYICIGIYMYTYTYIYKYICVHDVHAHTHLSHKDTLPTYICIMHTYRYRYICIYACISIHTFIPCLLRAAIPTHVGARACACPHVCAHTRERVSAAPPRTPARAAPTTRRARPACGGAPPGPERRRTHRPTR